MKYNILEFLPTSIWTWKVGRIILKKENWEWILQWANINEDNIIEKWEDLISVIIEANNVLYKLYENVWISWTKKFIENYYKILKDVNKLELLPESLNINWEIAKLNIDRSYLPTWKINSENWNMIYEVVSRISYQKENNEILKNFILEDKNYDKIQEIILNNL